MIELRWVKRTFEFKDINGYPTLSTEKVLQYRSYQILFDKWTEWTDVPVVEEENE
jgi:hypothetical protein